MKLVDHPELLDQLAASYALGTLRGGARRRFEAMARESATVRSSALIWHERLASLTELQPAHVPSANVWKRIENLLAVQQAGVAAVAATAATAPLPGQAVSALQAGAERALRWWRGAGLVAATTAVVAVVAGINLQQEVGRQSSALALARIETSAVQTERAALTARLQAMPNIQYVSVLQNDQSTASMLVTVDRDRNTVTLKRVDGYQEPGDKSLELWALPASGKPQSLGILASDRTMRIPNAAGQASDAPTLAITLEPKGGAPGPGPTGPILFKGAMLQTAL